uniref:Uncharacterized protein n=1 Tax=Panagrolaimus sp. PS1159 TaxID=55785 RepID=A0AC35FC88_9BILA
MKLSVSFLVLVAVFQFGTSNILSKHEILLSDASAVQDVDDVKMVKPGPLGVILKNASELIFGVCSMKCTSDFLVCYEPNSSGQNVLESCDTKCVDKSDQCFEVKMKKGKTNVLDLEREVAKPETCAPKFENGIVKLNINNASSDCVVSIKNAIIKPETTTAPSTTTTTTGQLDQTLSESAASTTEPGSFFTDYWWIFLILGIILLAVGIGIGAGVYCYLCRKKNAQIPTPARRRKLQGSKSPIVLQASTETQQKKTESAVRPNSLYQQSSILSHKSLLYSKKEEAKKGEPELTDLTSMKPTA